MHDDYKSKSKQVKSRNYKWIKDVTYNILVPANMIALYRW